MKRKPAKTFQDLIVWKKAHEFVLTILLEAYIVSILNSDS